MKKFVVGVVGVAVAIVGLAMTNAHGAEKTFCENQYELAHGIMNLRQSHTAKSIVESVVYTESTQAIVDAAYAKVIVPEKAKPIVIKRFAQDVQAICEEAYAGVAM